MMTPMDYWRRPSMEEEMVIAQMVWFPVFFTMLLCRAF